MKFVEFILTFTGFDLVDNPLLTLLFLIILWPWIKIIGCFCHLLTFFIFRLIRKQKILLGFLFFISVTKVHLWFFLQVFLTVDRLSLELFVGGVAAKWYFWVSFSKNFDCNLWLFNSCYLIALNFSTFFTHFIFWLVCFFCFFSHWHFLLLPLN